MSVRLADSARSLSLSGAVMAALLFLGACTSTGSASSTTTPVVSSVVAPSTLPTPTVTASPASTTALAATAAQSSSQDVTDAWSAYWDAWAVVRASDDLDPAPLSVVARAEVVEGAVALFERQRSSGSGGVETVVVLHPTLTDLDSDRASVEDCVLLSPSFTETVGVWYQADLTRSGSGWVVSAVRIPSGGGCVPQEMADSAIAGYEAFYNGWADFWDPPNPDSALIATVLSEPQKSLITDLLGEHQDRGVALRGRPALHPEVVDVRSSTELVILSCLQPASDYGVYDIASGERLDDVPAVRTGQRNLESAVMVLDGGLWKVSDFQGQVDFVCEFAPTGRGLPSV